MNSHRLVAAALVAILLVTVTAVVATQRAAAQCLPGQACPPPAGEKEKKTRPTETPSPVPTPVNAPAPVTGALPIVPAAGGPPNTQDGNAGGSGGGSNNPSSGSPFGMPWLFGLIIVVCFVLVGGGLFLSRRTKGLGEIGGSGGFSMGGKENFTVTVRDVTDGFAKIEQGTIEANTIGGIEMNTIGGTQNATVTRQDLGGGAQMGTLSGKDIGEMGGTL